MKDTNGNVTINEQVPTDRLNSYVEEKINDWIQTLGTTDVDYEVAFFDEEAVGEISCLIVVHVSGPDGTQLWRAWETADNPRTALSRSIASLTMTDNGDASKTQNLTH